MLDGNLKLVHTSQKAVANADMGNKGLSGIEYLFLPGREGDAYGAAKRAYELLINKQVPMKNIEIYYMNKNGTSTQYLPSEF